MQVHSYPQARVPDRFRSQVLTAQAEAWPPADPTARRAEWPTHDPALQPITMILVAGDWDLGLFTCDRPLQPFYERAGWHPLPGAVLVGGTVAAPFASDQEGFDKVTMVEFFSPLARRHQATFPRSRITLHSGEIDKLW